MTDLNSVQLRLEQEAVDYGTARYYRAVDDGGVEATGVGQRYIRSLVEPLTAAIDDWRQSTALGRSSIGAEVVPVIADVDSAALAYLTLRVATQAATRAAYLSLASWSITLGGMVEEHAAWARTAARQDLKGYMHIVSRSLANSTSERHRRAVARHITRTKGEVPAWDDRTRAAVGTHLLERCIQATGHFERQIVGTGRRTKTLLTMQADVDGALKAAHERVAGLTPRHGPMVVPPLDWDADGAGGYLTFEVPLMAGSLHAQAAAERGSTEVSAGVLEALNVLQRTPWAVNTAILRVMRQAWDNQDLVAGLPDQEPAPLPAKPHDIADNPESRRLWKREASAIHAGNAMAVSKRMGAMMLLAEAEKMTEFERIYFPHQLDWRGRVYTVSSQLNPQGSDRDRALLRFAAGKPLGTHGAYWLAVHLANLYGYDKVSLDERARWTAENSGNILESALSPLDGTRWWTGADKPWTFLAACIEWAGFSMQGPDYVSRLPVHVDGSCNGLQHFAAMLKDPTSAEAVNLLPGPAPRDVYQTVADAVTRSVWNQPPPDDGGPNLSDLMVIAWPEGVPRSLVKRPVMTLPYGVTRYGMRDQVQQELTSAGLFGEYRSECASLLAEHIHTAVGSVVSAADRVMTWLQACADAFIAADLPVRWLSSAGLPVTQDYRVQGGSRIAVYVGGQRVQVQLAYVTEQRNARKQRAGISPNFVHSQDAAHLVAAVLRCKDNDITSITTIHDSYGTLAADVDTLNVILRETFADMYRGDVLSELAASFRSQGVDVPDPPASGELDIDQVGGAAYFFA